MISSLLLLVNVLRALERILDEKARGYKDPAHACLFQLNNYNYIWQMLGDPESALLGYVTPREQVKWEKLVNLLQQSYLSRYDVTPP